LGTISILTGSHLFPVGRVFQVAKTLAAVYLSLCQPSPLPPPLDTAPGNPNKNTITTTRRHQVTSPPKQNPKRTPPQKKATQNQNFTWSFKQRTREKTKLEYASAQNERREHKSSDGAASNATKQQRSLAGSLLELLLPQTLDAKGMKTMELPDS
jgi:hypothetical protein